MVNLNWNEVVNLAGISKIGDLKLLFTADSGIETYQSQNLLNQELKDLDWLQLPHHGSKNNSSKIMLDHFNPKIVFVSAKGKENRPSSTITKCLNEKSNFKELLITNGDENTWYLKIENDLVPHRINL